MRHTFAVILPCQDTTDEIPQAFHRNYSPLGLAGYLAGDRDVTQCPPRHVVCRLHSGMLYKRKQVWEMPLRHQDMFVQGSIARIAIPLKDVL